jgi:hypothetical protein
MGLGLERAGRGERGAVSQRVGWLALGFATCGWLFLWNAISTFGIYCGGEPDCPPLLAIVPRYLALAGMGLSAVAIAVSLARTRLAPRWLGTAAIVGAAIGSLLLLVEIVGEYDAITSSMSSGWLDQRYRPPMVPPVIRSLAALWPVFLGAWMTLASLQLVRIGVPNLIALIGVVAGIAIVVTMPYALDYFVRTSILPLELILSLVWATAVGVYVTTLRRVSATA